MGSYDAHANFASSTVATAPSPANSGLTLTVQVGDGAKFPKPPFNCTATNPNSQQEIIRVTAIAADTFTVLRAQEGSSAINLSVGSAIVNTSTAKVFTDIENSIIPSVIGLS